MNHYPQALPSSAADKSVSLIELLNQIHLEADRIDCSTAEGAGEHLGMMRAAYLIRQHSSNMGSGAVNDGVPVAASHQPSEISGGDKIADIVSKIRRVIKETLDVPTLHSPEANCRNLTRAMQRIEQIIEDAPTCMPYANEKKPVLLQDIRNKLGRAFLMGDYTIEQVLEAAGIPYTEAALAGGEKGE